MTPTEKPSWESLLAKSDIIVDEAMLADLEKLAGLVRQWSNITSLVSENDRQQIWDRHIVDSLSLAPIVHSVSVRGGKLLDIGSGGGFPALVLRIAMPTLKVSLVERSSRKVGILRNIVAGMGMTNIAIHHGEFPQSPPEALSGFSMITARAVEEPEKLAKALIPRLSTGTVFVCQSGDVRTFEQAKMQVVEVRDAWTEAGLRRGHLHLVYR